MGHGIPHIGGSRNNRKGIPNLDLVSLLCWDGILPKSPSGTFQQHNYYKFLQISGPCCHHPWRFPKKISSFATHGLEPGLTPKLQADADTTELSSMPVTIASHYASDYLSRQAERVSSCSVSVVCKLSFVCIGTLRLSFYFVWTVDGEIVGCCHCNGKRTMQSAMQARLSGCSLS